MEILESKTKIYKTKPYVMRAVSKYYNKNKSTISKKNQLKSFQNKINSMITMLENIEHNYYIKMNTLTKISSYKMWQTSNTIRQQYKDRIAAIINTVVNEDNQMEFHCLRLFDQDETYTGNYHRAQPLETTS
jgi:hypothetical protein